MAADKEMISNYSWLANSKMDEDIGMKQSEIRGILPGIEQQNENKTVKHQRKRRNTSLYAKLVFVRRLTWFII